MIARFNSERKILATLNHPYIAQLIDGGTTKDGLPYLVMEYVDGSPIDHYCDRNKLSVRDRLELIRKVAVAVQSAHNSLVVHRDLKPSNVLITDDGIPKLLDFGIAKLIQSDTPGSSGETTVFGTQALTPDYASPEQILDGQVTTSSDVYSLGVMTYQLLTGERPYSVSTSSHREMIRSIESLSITRPSANVQTTEISPAANRTAVNRATTPARLKKALAGDLDTILLKALHREPERRYTSVASFGDDLGRYLSGKPVEAQGDSLLYLTKRFVHRNRVIVAGVAALFLALTAGLVGTTTAYFRAEAAREKADRMFEQVRSISKKMMFDVYDDVQAVPGSSSAQRTIAKTSQEYLATLVDAEGADTYMKLEAARGYSRMANAFDRETELGQEGREIAEDSYEKGFALLYELVDTHPFPYDVYYTLGQTHSNRGYILLYTENDVEAAREELLAAHDIYQKAEALKPDDLDIRSLRFQNQIRLTDTYAWQNEYDQALSQIDSLLADMTAQRERHPENVDLLEMHSSMSRQRGEILEQAERFEEAIVEFDKSLVLFDEHREKAGKNSIVDSGRMLVYWRKGSAEHSLGRPEEALESLQGAIDLMQERIDRDAGDLYAISSKNIILVSRAESLAATGQVDQAVETLVEVNDWFIDRLQIEDSPSNHRTIAANYLTMGDVTFNADRKREALRYYQQAKAKWAEIDERWGLSDYDVEQPGIVDEKIALCAS